MTTAWVSQLLSEGSWAAYLDAAKGSETAVSVSMLSICEDCGPSPKRVGPPSINCSFSKSTRGSKADEYFDDIPLIAEGNINILRRELRSRAVAAQTLGVGELVKDNVRDPKVEGIGPPYILCGRIGAR